MKLCNICLPETPYTTMLIAPASTVRGHPPGEVSFITQCNNRNIDTQRFESLRKRQAFCTCTLVCQDLFRFAEIFHTFSMISHFASEPPQYRELSRGDSLINPIQRKE